MPSSSNSLWLSIVKAALAGLLYILGTIVFGAIATAMHIPMPNLTPAGVSVNPQAALRIFLLLAPLLGIGLLPLALGSSGKWLTRGLALSFLLFVTMGLNNAIEMKIFTLFLLHGAKVFVASVVPPALLCGVALAFLIQRDSGSPSLADRARSFFAAHSVASWSWRFLLAILAFPLVYLVFGAMVAPIVVPVYRAANIGLVLPPLSVILPVQVLRSVIFLLASLPFFLLWTRRRGALIFGLGFHWLLVALFGLLMISWIPLPVRAAHLLEGAADSFAYAAALVFLLLPHKRENPLPIPGHTVPMFPS